MTQLKTSLGIALAVVVFIVLVLVSDIVIRITVGPGGSLVGELLYGYLTGVFASLLAFQVAKHFSNGSEAAVIFVVLLALAFKAYMAFSIATTEQANEALPVGLEALSKNLQLVNLLGSAVGVVSAFFVDRRY